jgi:hypothetical protein
MSDPKMETRGFEQERAENMPQFLFFLFQLTCSRSSGHIDQCLSNSLDHIMVTVMENMEFTLEQLDGKIWLLDISSKGERHHTELIDMVQQSVGLLQVH